MLGEFSYSGNREAGVERDYKQSVEWLQKAADQGHAKALYNLGMCW